MMPHRVFSVPEQARLIAVSTLLGLSIGLACAWTVLHAAPPARFLDPVIERAEADYSVYRIRFEWLGIEAAPCHFVAWHQSGKWTAKCGAL